MSKASGPHVIIDIGTYQTRAGLASDSAPRVVQPTLVGRGVGEVILTLFFVYQIT